MKYLWLVSHIIYGLLEDQPLLIVLYKLPIDHLGKEPKNREELFIPLMQKDTQSMTQI